MLKFRGKTAMKIELFPAEQWGSHPDADEGLFRLRRDGQWVAVNGRHTFFTPGAAFAFMAREALGHGTQEAGREEKIRRGARVRVSSLDPDVSLQGFAASRPFVGMDGRARVFVCGYEEPFLLDDVRGLP